MKVTDREKWNRWIKNNQDPYGSGVVRYAKAWAELMEKRMAQGEKLEDTAKQCSHEADTEGITGFMYGAAVSVLASCWTYGEELQVWHSMEASQ